MSRPVEAGSFPRIVYFPTIDPRLLGTSGVHPTAIPNHHTHLGSRTPLHRDLAGCPHMHEPRRHTAHNSQGQIHRTSVGAVAMQSQKLCLREH